MRVLLIVIGRSNEPNSELHDYKAGAAHMPHYYVVVNCRLQVV